MCDIQLLVDGFILIRIASRKILPSGKIFVSLPSTPLCLCRRTCVCFELIMVLTRWRAPLALSGKIAQEASRLKGLHTPLLYRCFSPGIPLAIFLEASYSLLLEGIVNLVRWDLHGNQMTPLPTYPGAARLAA